MCSCSSCCRFSCCHPRRGSASVVAVAVAFCRPSPRRICYSKSCSGGVEGHTEGTKRDGTYLPVPRVQAKQRAETRAKLPERVATFLINPANLGRKLWHSRYRVRPAASFFTSSSSQSCKESCTVDDSAPHRL